MTQSLITGVINTTCEMILKSQRQKKQVQIERKFVWSNSLLEKLTVMNTTKTELKQYTLVNIIAADTSHNSTRRVYFDRVANYQTCKRGWQEGHECGNSDR